MSKVLDFPGVDVIFTQTPPPQHLRYWEGTVHKKIFDASKPATAMAVLMHPPAGRKFQRVLVLPRANFVRGEGAGSEQRAQQRTIEFLSAQRSFAQTQDGKHFWLIKPVLFPSLSRASSCISRTNTNGWREWLVFPGEVGSDLSSIGEMLERRPDELCYYDGYPEDTVVVPYRL